VTRAPMSSRSPGKELPKKEGKSKAERKAENDVAQSDAIKALTAVYAVLDKYPSVRQDPMVKALLTGLVKKDEDFKVSAMTVATLRNAGCFNPTASAAAPEKVKSAPKEKQPNANGKKDETPREKKTANVRSFTRSIDYLIATFIIDEDDDALKLLRNDLRSDKNKVIDLVKGDEPISRKVSEIGDFDLLYLSDEEAYNAFMKRIGKIQEDDKKSAGGVYTGIGRFWNQDGPASEFLGEFSELIGAGKKSQIFTSTYGYLAQQLKGPVLDLIEKTLTEKAVQKGTIIPDGADEVELYRSIVQLLKVQPWFKFGKSPTIKRAAATESKGSTSKAAATPKPVA